MSDELKAFEKWWKRRIRGIEQQRVSVDDVKAAWIACTAQKYNHIETLERALKVAVSYIWGRQGDKTPPQRYAQRTLDVILEALKGKATK